MKKSVAREKVLFWSLPLVLAAAAHADVELVRDGKPLAEIVLATNALTSVKLAADDLQKYIELMSGARLPIIDAISDAVKTRVFVGSGDYAEKLGVTVGDLAVEEFRIIAKDNYILLIGRDEQRRPFPYSHHGPSLRKWWEFAGEKYGIPYHVPFNSRVGFFPHDATATLYASSELLEQLGVRWYHPYENGTVVPKRESIAVREQALSKAPVFAIRQPAYYPQHCDGDALRWFKRLKYGSSYLYGGAHATQAIIGRPEQKEEHPEYFAMANGKRLGSIRRGVPRFCNESFRKTSIHFLKKSFEAYPYLVALDLMPTDGLGKIDERDAKLWARPGRGYGSAYSDYIWDYWLWAARELKKVRPDKYLVAWSYSPYAEPPSGLDKLPDNVAMYLCQNTASLMLPQHKRVTDIRARFLSMLTSRKMFVYDYYLFYRSEQSPRYPVFFTRLLQKDMQALRGVCEGKNIEIASEYVNKQHRLACPGLTHMLHYWQGKLYWDPDTDREALLSEYYALYFGPAKAEMQEFYEFAEEVWMRPKSRSIAGGGHGFLQAEDVDRYFEILVRARQKAGADTVFDKRIAQIETEMQPLKLLPVGMKRSGPDFQLYTSRESVKIDGDLKEPFWAGQRSWHWYTMRDLVTGEALGKNRTKVTFRMTADRSSLVIAVICDESKMDGIHAKAQGPDDFSIFNDDVIETYIETPERSYFKIVVNAEGEIWDETQDVTLITRDTLPTLWNPGTRAAVKKGDKRWTLELLIPTKDFGSLGPTRDYPWGVNVCRTRMAGGEMECSAISPTGEVFFARIPKWGNLRPR